MDSTLLSFWPNSLALNTSDSCRYLFDATSTTLPLYFALKQKHHYRLANETRFLETVAPLLQQAATRYDLVVYPQSRSSLLRELTKDIPSALELRKRAKDEIVELTKAQAGWSKQERRSQQQAWATMGDVFEINKIKSNQRKHYVPFLFEALTLEHEKVLILDDFVMSGTTVNALKVAIDRPDCDCLGLFHQRQYAAQKEKTAGQAVF